MDFYEDDTVAYAITRKEARRNRRMNNWIFEKMYYGIKKDSIPKWKRSRRGKRADFNIAHKDDTPVDLLYWSYDDYEDRELYDNSWIGSSSDLTEKIYNVEHASIEQRKEWIVSDKKKWVLDEYTTLSLSNDYMCWYLEKYDPYQCREFIKIVPAYSLKKETIRDILVVQPWVHI